MPTCLHFNLAMEEPVKPPGVGAWASFKCEGCMKAVDLDVTVLQAKFGRDLNTDTALDFIRDEIEERGKGPAGRLLKGPWAS